MPPTCIRCRAPGKGAQKHAFAAEYMNRGARMGGMHMSTRIPRPTKLRLKVSSPTSWTKASTCRHGTSTLSPARVKTQSARHRRPQRHGGRPDGRLCCSGILCRLLLHSHKDSFRHGWAGDARECTKLTRGRWAASWAATSSCVAASSALAQRPISSTGTSTRPIAAIIPPPLLGSFGVLRQIAQFWSFQATPHQHPFGGVAWNKRGQKGVKDLTI